jgi:D-alanyl-D-alanine carboxypeptidase-like protein
MALDFAYPNADAARRGWGAGWPNCQTSRMVPLVAGVSFGSIRTEIHDLVVALVVETASRGYPPKAGSCFGFACRPTKRADGTYTTTPSNHSWGLAVDYNTLENVYGAPESASVIATKQKWMVDLWHEYGFRWLGPAIADWEHFDFCGTPTDAAQMTAKALAGLGGGGDDVKQLDDYIDGREKFYEAAKAAGGDPGGAPANWNNPYRKQGWHQAREDYRLARALDSPPTA